MKENIIEFDSLQFSLNQIYEPVKEGLNSESFQNFNNNVEEIYNKYIKENPEFPKFPLSKINYLLDVLINYLEQLQDNTIDTTYLFVFAKEINKMLADIINGNYSDKEPFYTKMMCLCKHTNKLALEMATNCKKYVNENEYEKAIDCVNALLFF